MSISKSITTVAVMAGLAAMNLVTLGSAAEAYDGRGRSFNDWGGSGHGRSWRYAAPRHGHSYYDGYGNHRRNKDKAYTRGLAIGLGAVVLGGILAAEANRRNGRYDYE